MSRRHTDIWSHPGHYLVDPYNWPNGQDHIWPWKFKYQCHGQGQTHYHISGLEFKSIYLPFVSWQSDQFWLRYTKFHTWPWKFKVKVTTKVKSDGHIWGLEFNWCVWPWKFTVKVMAKVKPDGHIWSLEFSRCVSAFRFMAIGHFWLRYSQFDIRPWNSRSRSRQKSAKILQVNL